MTRGPFLERPGNFASPKADFKIKTAQFLAHKPGHFALLTDSFIVSFAKLLKFDFECKLGKHKQLFRSEKLPGLSRNRPQHLIKVFKSIN